MRSATVLAGAELATSDATSLSAAGRLTSLADAVATRSNRSGIRRGAGFWHSVRAHAGFGLHLGRRLEPKCGVRHDQCAFGRSREKLDRCRHAWEERALRV